MEEKQLYLSGLDGENPRAAGNKKVGLSWDILAITGVVFLISLIISFSLGVEKGKRIADNNWELKQRAAWQNQQQAVQNMGLAVTEMKPQPKEEKEDSRFEEKKPPIEVVEDSKQKYKIQVASFQKENMARKEAEELEQKGYPVFIAKKGKYIGIYVGEFNSKSEAKANFETLRKTYRDCILWEL